MSTAETLATLRNGMLAVSSGVIRARLHARGDLVFQEGSPNVIAQVYGPDSERLASWFAQVPELLEMSAKLLDDAVTALEALEVAK